MSDDRSSGLKSAYERALERLDEQGIGRPEEEALDDATRERMAEVRRRATARLAELEILHRDRVAGIEDGETRAEAEGEYLEERRRIEARRDAELDQLRREA